MPLEITFALSDNDLERFQAVVDEARAAMEKQQTEDEIEAAARHLIRASRSDALPEFVAERLRKLDIVINMINDDEWALSKTERHQVLGALAYLCNPQDLIPDDIPGLGYLDDAIYAEIVLGELHNEISLYQEFCDFRVAEEARREKRGDDIKIGREEWLADKRVALQAKMRKRRLRPGGHGNWRMRLW